MNIDEQQAILSEVTPALKLIDPKFCVAGGAPRDWHMGVPCKDVNVYLRPLHAFTKNLASEIADPLAAILGVPITVKIAGNRKSSTLATAAFKYEGLDFELNFLDATMKNPNKVMSEFDYDVCAIEYDTDTQMPIPTRQFFKAMMSKEIQYLPEVTEDSPRYKRMKELFPNFKHTFLKEEDRKKMKIAPAGEVVDPADWKFIIDEGQVVEFGE